MRNDFAAVLSTAVGSVAARSSARQRIAHGGEAERHGDAVVGIADHAVELAEPVLVGLDRHGDRIEHSYQVSGVDASLDCSLVSRPGTWRSRRDGRASSAVPRRDAYSVTEAPAISSDVQ